MFALYWNIVAVDGLKLENRNFGKMKRVYGFQFTVTG